MAGKGKHNGPARKKTAVPQEGEQPPGEKPTAQIQTAGGSVISGEPTTGGVGVGNSARLAVFPAKPSEEAEAVEKIVAMTAESMSGMLASDPRATRAIAQAVVRRFPGLTRKPGVPRPVREDALLAKRGRLPDGSIVLAVWDEAAGVWAGQLVTKPAVGLAGMLRDMVLRSGEHHATSWPGLFGLMNRLDRLYREWLGRQKGGGA